MTVRPLAFVSGCLLAAACAAPLSSANPAAAAQEPSTTATAPQETARPESAPAAAPASAIIERADTFRIGPEDVLDEKTDLRIGTEARLQNARFTGADLPGVLCEVGASNERERHRFLQHQDARGLGGVGRPFRPIGRRLKSGRRTRRQPIGPGLWPCRETAGRDHGRHNPALSKDHGYRSYDGRDRCLTGTITEWLARGAPWLASGRPNP